MVRASRRCGLSGPGDRSVRSPGSPATGADSSGRGSRGQLGLVSRRRGRDRRPDCDRRLARLCRRHCLPSPVEPGHGCAARVLHHWDPGCADLAVGRGAVAGPPAPRFRPGGDPVAGRSSRAEVGRRRFARVDGQRDASVGHRSLVAYRALVRATGNRAGRRTLCPLPLAAPRALGARVAGSCGTCSLVCQGHRPASHAVARHARG